MRHESNLDAKRIAIVAIDLQKGIACVVKQASGKLHFVALCEKKPTLAER
jgi:hypothetical protein